MSTLVSLQRPATKDGNDEGSAAQPRARFASFDALVEGWYWLLRARDLKRGQVRALRVLGRDLVVYRGQDGVARAMDAHCPHMGAHLAEGKVDGEGVRCFFHHWKLGPTGEVVDVPCQRVPPRAKNRVWPVAEAYGLLWIWTGDVPRHPVPYIPEVEGRALEVRVGNRFEKGCHPNVVMVNAIDEQHFHSVHPMASSLADGLHFAISAPNENCQIFDNDRPVPRNSMLNRLLSRWYAGPLTYRMVYWNGTTGSVTIGPDFLHFHIIFALRPTEEGRTEGITLLVTERRTGALGWWTNQVILRVTDVVGRYFARGDTQVFQTIRWNFRTPIKADRPILAFQKHLEDQPAVAWGTWSASDLAAKLSSSPRAAGAPLPDTPAPLPSAGSAR